MSRIEVTPVSLSETARRLRTASVDAQRARRALAAAGPSVTGSADLSAALSEHAEAWGWSLSRLAGRVRDVARSLDTGAAAYDRTEEAAVRPRQE